MQSTYADDANLRISCVLFHEVPSPLSPTVLHRPTSSSSQLLGLQTPPASGEFTSHSIALSRAVYLPNRDNLTLTALLCLAVPRTINCSHRTWVCLHFTLTSSLTSPATYSIPELLPCLPLCPSVFSVAWISYLYTRYRVSLWARRCHSRNSRPHFKGDLVDLVFPTESTTLCLPFPSSPTPLVPY